jgi:glutaredoxin
MVEMAVKRRLILIVAEGCPGCEQAKQAVENSWAKIEVLDVTKSEEAAKICKRALKTVQLSTASSLKPKNLFACIANFSPATC